jgi:hypothetical protein
MLGKHELEIEMGKRVGRYMETTKQNPTYSMVYIMCAEVAIQEFKKECPITMTDLKAIFKEINARNDGKNDYISRGDVAVMLSCIKGIEE